MIRRTTHSKMSLAFLSPTSVLPRINYCGGHHLVFPGPKVHHPRNFQPSLRSVFAGFDSDFFAMPSRLLDFPPTLTHFKDEIMRHSSPRYEITENDEQFRLAVDVPGMKPDNLKIELEDDGRILHVSGERKVKTDTSHEEYLFDKRFTLRKDLDTSKITAHLSDGVLVVTAMKMKTLPPATQPIAIVQGEAPAMMDAGGKTMSDQVAP
jgi:HSP20 family protein